MGSNPSKQIPQGMPTINQDVIVDSQKPNYSPKLVSLEIKDNHSAEQISSYVFNSHFIIGEPNVRRQSQIVYPQQANDPGSSMDSDIFMDEGEMSDDLAFPTIMVNLRRENQRVKNSRLIGRITAQSSREISFRQIESTSSLQYKQVKGILKQQFKGAHLGQSDRSIKSVDKSVRFATLPKQTQRPQSQFKGKTKSCKGGTKKNRCTIVGRSFK